MACFRPRWAAAWCSWRNGGQEKPGGPSKRFFHGYSGGIGTKNGKKQINTNNLLYDDIVPWIVLGQKLKIAKYIKIFNLVENLAESLEHFLVFFVQAWPFHVGVHFCLHCFVWICYKMHQKTHKTTTHQRKFYKRFKKCQVNLTIWTHAKNAKNAKTWFNKVVKHAKWPKNAKC